jgi:hypothetical protein
VKLAITGNRSRNRFLPAINIVGVDCGTKVLVCEGISLSNTEIGFAYLAGDKPPLGQA